MNEEKFKKMLDHYRKYTLTSDEIIRLSDWEWNLYLQECKDAKQEIENEFKETK